jgi:23S rRNA (guanosine2251-2'-O)-methyltransferase
MALQIHNPHSVLAALQTRPQDVLEIMIPGGGPGGVQAASDNDAWGRVADLARQKKVPLHSAQRGGGRPQGRRDGRGEGRGDSDGRTSSAHASIKERTGIAVEELFSNAREKKGGHGLWLALDSLQDPHNVGAIFRAAGFFGVQGILLTSERSAPLTATVYDVACGGVEYVPFTLQTNLQRAFEVAKEAGLWILGTSEHAHDSLSSIQKDRPWLMVLGNEEKGMRRLTEEACDLLCKIPSAGRVTSLNVSVAAGILISTLS